MACKVLFSSPSPFNACSAPASIREVIEVVVIDLLLCGLARVWETFPWLALLLHLWILVLTNLRRSRRRRIRRSRRCRDWLVGEEIGKILFLNLVAQYLWCLRVVSQTFLEARANHHALSRRARVFSVLGSYEAADVVA